MKYPVVEVINTASTDVLTCPNSSAVGPMKKLAVLFLLASMCACVHSQVKVTGSASVSGTAAINANSNVTVSSLVVTPANQTVDVGQAIGYTATVTFSDGTTLNVTNYGNWSSSNVAVAGIRF
jgi:uncharacterized protein YjdB